MTGSNDLSPEVIDLLRCPVTRSRLYREGDWLIAAQGGRRYPILGGIPVLLEESARPVEIDPGTNSPRAPGQVEPSD